MQIFLKRRNVVDDPNNQATEYEVGSYVFDYKNLELQTSFK